MLRMVFTSSLCSRTLYRGMMIFSPVYDRVVLVSGCSAMVKGLARG